MGQIKASLVIFFMKKAIRNNIVAKKTTELVLFFHKDITKLVFICPNMSQKSIKVFIKLLKYINTQVKFTNHTYSFYYMYKYQKKEKQI